MPTDMTSEEVAERDLEAFEAREAEYEAWRCSVNLEYHNEQQRQRPPCDPDRCVHRTRARDLAAQALVWLDRGEPAHARDLLRQIAGGDA